MKIGIYANIDYGNPGGVQQYIERLVKALVDYTHEDIFVITNKAFYDNYFKHLDNKEHLTCLVCENDEYEIRQAVSKIDLDVLHFPFQIFPYYYWNLPTVISLHDLQHEMFPEFFTEEELDFRNKYYYKSAHMCDQIVVSYEHIKSDIVKFLRVPKDKISVAVMGMEGKAERLGEERVDVLEKYEIKGDYILYPAQTWKHKNHIRLLQAIKAIKDKYKKDILLICTGRKNENYENIEKYINDNGLQSNVKFLDFVPEEDLAALYRKTKLVVIPTLYEAGSFPLYEAISLGVPVICSNVTSLPDTIGDSRFVFNPYDIDEISEKIMLMLDNENLRKDNVNNSSAQVKKYDWNVKINGFIEAYIHAKENFNYYKKYKDMFFNRIVFENEHEDKLQRVNKIIDEIPDEARILIYAAGIHTVHLLKDTNLSKKNVVGIVDKNQFGKELLGHNIEGIDRINTINPDVIVISSFKYQNEIEDFLRNTVSYKGQIIKIYTDQKDVFYL